MRFKRILLSTLALMSIVLWTPLAQAIPAFARQTGMACDACHFQHFPVLNSFGRAFKEGGFTMMGSQETITGNLGLSIPVVINAAIEAYSGYTKTNGPSTATATTKNTNDGQFNAISSSSVFFGGRVGEHVGFEAELNIYPTPAGLLNYKMPIVFDAGSAKVGGVIYSTAVYGPSFGLEVMNTGANGVHLFNQFDMPVISAQQYLNTGLPAQGIDLIASNDMGFAVLGKWLPDQASSSGSPTSNYLRIAATPADLIPGFDFGVGVQFWSGTGSSSGNAPGTVGSGGGVCPTAPGAFIGNPVAPVGGTQPECGVFDTKASAIDAQLLGDVSGMPLTLIASYASAPSSGAPTGVLDGFQGNIFNPGTATRSSFNMGAELGVTPRVTLQAGLRRANSGFAIGSISNATDNAWLIGATYKISLNVRADLTFSKYSGDMYSTASQQIQGTGYMGDSFTSLYLIAAF
ncbi:MAG: hypothetical protein WB870_06285 [Gallionellaceae bacterium]